MTSHVAVTSWTGHQTYRQPKKGHHQHHKKATDRMKGNICKSCTYWGTDIQNIFKISVTQQQNKPNQKWAKNVNRHFLTEDMQAANEHLERCSASLVIRGIWLKTMRYHLTSTRTATIRTEDNKCWEKHGETQPLVLCWWVRKMVPLPQTTMWLPFKNQAGYCTIQQFHLWNCKQISRQVFGASMFTGAWLTVARGWQ